MEFTKRKSSVPSPSSASEQTPLEHRDLWTLKREISHVSLCGDGSYETFPDSSTTNSLNTKTATLPLPQYS